MMWLFPARELPSDIGAAFSAIAAIRHRGRHVSSSAYERLMLECVSAGYTVACYRLMEEAAADGLRLSKFSALARHELANLVPPEAEDLLEGTRSVGRSRSRSGVLITDELPELWVTPSVPVQTFDCRPGEAREEALAAAWAAVSKRDAPVLFRGVGAQWPALRSWSLPRLVRSMQRAMVRVAPSNCVTFCRESHPDVRSGAVVPPSRITIMNVAEFADRLHVGRAGRSPLMYGAGERCYLQALAPYSMMRELDFSFLPEQQPQPQRRRRQQQQRQRQRGWPGPRELLARLRRHPLTTTPLGRLWVSSPGTLSPLHYDETDSYLAQVRGEKRLLLWPADALEALRPYPATSPLARRLMVDITGSTPPDGLSAAALDAIATPLEAVLRPGDVLYFPRAWAHHTEALLPSPGSAPEPSFSLGFRTDGQFLL
jgi:hypothetical protein